MSVKKKQGLAKQGPGRDEQLADLKKHLAYGKTWSEACSFAGVPEDKKSEFFEALSSEQEQSILPVRTAVMDRMEIALQTLVDCCSAENEQVRVAAAKGILDAIIKTHQKPSDTKKPSSALQPKRVELWDFA